MRAWLERLLIRLGIRATPEDDAYYAWADERLDHIALHRNLAARGDRLDDDCEDLP